MFRNARALPTQQLGVSMIELMIALAISTFLILGVFQIFLGSNSTDRVAHAYARIQENGRLAMDILNRNLRMAGYQGCIDPELIDMNIIADNPPTTDLTNEGITGYETDGGTWSPTQDTGLANISGTLVGSDVVYIQYTSPTGVTVDCSGGGFSCEAVSAEVKIENNSIGLNQYDIVVISDCESADMFRISGMGTNGGKTTLAHANSTNSDINLSKPYDEDAEVMTFEAVAYYIKDTGRNNTHGENINALYQFDATYHASGSSTVTGKEYELVEGVEQLQILYGERLASGNMRFVAADDGSLNFGDVEAIRISILVSGTEPVLQADDDKTYKLTGADIKPEGTSGAEATYPDDRRLRQVFTNTIYLRNLAQ